MKARQQDSKDQRDRFLAQFEKSRREVATWPKWMRDAAVMASAHFPTKK